MLYPKEFNRYTGSVKATLLFSQVNYWFSKMRKPFFKFLQPCLHHAYTKASQNSWTEDLNFTLHEVKMVLKKCATKLKRGQKYDLLKCGLVLYWNGGNGITYYAPNYPLMQHLNIESDAFKSAFPYFQKWKNAFPKDDKASWEIMFLPSPKFDFGVSNINKNQNQSQKESKKKKGFFYYFFFKY